MSATVTDIKDAPGPLNLILRRRAEIKARSEEIRVQQSAASDELNAMYKEDQDLSRAEATVRKLMERRP